MYKFDTHVHCVEGSYDGEVSILDTVKRLKELGYSGMVITDHDSYNGWRFYQENKAEDEDFIVIKGIELTTNSGHLIAIPYSENDDHLENCAGQTPQFFIKEARKYGFLIGIPHPYCEFYGACTYMDPMCDEDLKLVDSLDFVEVFNPGTTSYSNRLAKEIADRLGKPKVSGSDSHQLEYVGYCGTYLKTLPKNNQEFIDAILDNQISSIHKKYY